LSSLTALKDEAKQAMAVRKQIVLEIIFGSLRFGAIVPEDRHLGFYRLGDRPDRIEPPNTRPPPIR